MYIDDCSSLQYTQLALFIVWSNFSPLVIQVGHHPVVLSVAIVTGLASLHRSGQQTSTHTRVCNSYHIKSLQYKSCLLIGQSEPQIQALGQMSSLKCLGDFKACVNTEIQSSVGHSFTGTHNSIFNVSHFFTSFLNTVSLNPHFTFQILISHSLAIRDNNSQNSLFHRFLSAVMPCQSIKQVPNQTLSWPLSIQ